MMLQQEQAESNVIATGVQYSVREFINWTALELGIILRFEGVGIDEVAIVERLEGADCSGVAVGDIIVRVDPRYFRPTEVDSLLGDPSKARDILGWVPEISTQEMCREMVRADLLESKKSKLLKSRGFLE